MRLNLQNRPFIFFMSLNNKILVLLTLIVILLDELSKVFAQKYFSVLCNKGIAFGLGAEGKITSFLALLLIFWILTQTKEIKFKLGLTLIFAGGLANMADRLISGCARDFLVVPMFPSFNLADVVITFGAVAIFFAVLVANKSEVPEDGNDRTF